MELVRKNLSYYYKLYGLNIKSDFYLSELSHSEHKSLDTIDVNIICGKCPETIDNIKTSNYYYTVSENEAMFSPDECGKFYIKDGNTIIIEPIKNCDYQHLKAYLLSRSFAILMFQRNTIALHGSSIIFNDKAYVFCGQSGAGKSSLSAALTLKGYDLLSDDLSVLSFDKNNKPYIHSGFSHNKLCIDTIKHLSISSENLLKVDNFADKYALPSSSTFIDTLFPISVLIEINVDYKNIYNNAVHLEEVNGHEKLQTILRNIFRYQLLDDVGLNSKYLKNCLHIANNIKVFKLIRPNGIFTIEQQINLIKKI